MPHDFEEAMKNPVYQKAKAEFLITRVEQIQKGSEKYDKPLDWRDWTPHQLVRHARQELVDQNHYLTCLELTIENMLSDIHWLLDNMEKLDHKIDWRRWEQINDKYQKEKPSE